MTNITEKILEQELYQRHLPAILRHRNDKNFEDNDYLDLGNRLIDEFWEKNRSKFVRNESARPSVTHLPGGVPDEWKIDDVLKSFLAAEIEIRISPPMTGIQKEVVAGIFSELALYFFRLRFYGHAKHCFRRAAAIFGDLRQFGEEDRCWYHYEKCSTKMLNGIEKLWNQTIDIISGFGYKPYRLILVEIIIWIFVALLFYQIDDSVGIKKAVLLSISGQLGFVGFGDIQKFPDVVEGISILQSFISLVLNATLFALLVRKWFR